MGLTKTLDHGAQVVVLYAKSFIWKGDAKTKLKMNVPETGRVYHALKEPQTGAFYVSVEQEPGTQVQGIRISDLTYSTSEFDCDMIQITDDNIVDFDIAPEDYKKINQWVDDDHNSFIKAFEGKTGINVIVPKEDVEQLGSDSISEGPVNENEEKLMELGRKIMDSLNQSTTTYENTAYDAIDFISDRDPWMLEAAAGILVYISKVMAKEDSGPTIPYSREISAHQELGRGANIYTAISCIENYINTDPKVGGNKNSLNKAIYHLILESIRLKMKRK